MRRLPLKVGRRSPGAAGETGDWDMVLTLIGMVRCLESLQWWVTWIYSDLLSGVKIGSDSRRFGGII